MRVSTVFSDTEKRGRFGLAAIVHYDQARGLALAEPVAAFVEHDGRQIRTDRTLGVEPVRRQPN
jgi:hypothetical protein